MKETEKSEVDIVGFAREKLRLNNEPLKFRVEFEDLAAQIAHMVAYDELIIVKHRSVGVSFSGIVANYNSARRCFNVNTHRQVGGSIFAGALSLALALNIPNYKVMILSPTLGMADALAQSKLMPLIMGAVRGFARRRGGDLKSCIEERISWGQGCNTLTRKVFDNGSAISIDGIGNHGECLRGCAADLIILDQGDHMTLDAKDIAYRCVTTNQGYIVSISSN